MFPAPRGLYEDYIRNHANKVNDPDISERQKQDCKWRIAEALDFQGEYDDFDRTDCTLTQEQESEVDKVVAEVLADD